MVTDIPEAELNLIIETIDGFIVQSRALKVENMTALMGALIEACVVVMSENTDPDTSLFVLSQILRRLGPKCNRGTVQVLSENTMSKEQH